MVADETHILLHMHFALPGVWSYASQDITPDFKGHLVWLGVT